MRMGFGLTLAAAVLFGVIPLPAQWFHYPTPGVPRLANGKPDLNAPAPKTADGKPDLSGIWLAGNALPCPKDLRDGQDCIEKIPLSHEAVDFGTNVPGGLPYQPWAAALVKQRVADLSKDDPHARCMPPNFPRAFAFPHLQKIIQIPGLLVILDEFNASYRQVFTDGRPFPEDPQPSWNGYSSGKWEGDTLVVQSIGFRDDLWLDMKGNPMTSAAKVTERFRRPGYGSLEIEVTVNDPKAYTKPWTVTLKQAIQVDTELADEICLENEKSVQHMTGK
ncbi:MAG: hypothetical protein ABSE57_10400 [Bryobacteraceae bacterium]